MAIFNLGFDFYLPLLNKHRYDVLPEYIHRSPLLFELVSSNNNHHVIRRDDNNVLTAKAERVIIIRFSAFLRFV